MKVKTFTAFGQGGLDKQVNRFLADSKLEVISVNFSVGFGYVGAMVVYK
ncbi:hypothetical protein [Lentilactobacillus kisonensis]|uniref:Uncharacterized protein n=1 Tax=Lentilactobacillus kisonensis F0435 TaxID=797516 RepID=H1LF73_9LACO|nr:hypothetical protein [Lentilactobacillus kisonensis]EHO52077.1 hypothetical protein HMPREF9104_01249 [Lentilactobacillus kisonensis F0435]